MGCHEVTFVYCPLTNHFEYGVFTLRARLHHGPWKMALFHGLTWWSNFHDPICLKNPVYKAFEPLTRCKPNVDQEEWPCTKKWMCLLFDTCPKRVVLKEKIQVWLFSCLLLSSSSFPPKKSLRFYYNNVSLPWAPTLSTIPPFWPLPPQNPLDHISG